MEKQPPLKINLQKLMELYNVPGLSVAVVDQYEIAWARAYGVTEPGSSTPVTTKILFRRAPSANP
jgi:CubicO group peptidase (beta-lactamase class C family)